MQLVAKARYSRIGITVAILGALLVVAVGGGYSASKSLLGDGAAYAVDGVGIDRLNAATGAPDAELLDMGRGTNRISVVHRDNQVYLVDTVLGSVTHLDPATLELGDTTTVPGAPKGGTGSVEVATGGGTTALVDLQRGILQRVDQVKLTPVGRPVKVQGGLTGAVADSSGVLWLGTGRAGVVLRVDKAGKQTPIPVASEGLAVTVTLVGDAPVVLVQPGGLITGIDPGTLRRSRVVKLPSDPESDLKLNIADTPGHDLWALDTAAHTLYRVDLTKGTVAGPVTIGAGQVRWGNPVVQAGRVYVPNLDEHRMVVVDAKSLHRLDEVTVPGDGPDFDVTIEGGALWANDPTTGTAVVIDRKGDVTTVGKGDGTGRVEPVAQPMPGDPPLSPPEQAPPVQPSLDLSQVPPPLPTPVTPPVATPAPQTPPRPAPPADSVVPDVRGLEQAAACAALVTVKLDCKPGEEDGGAVGEVSKQDPAPGRTLPPGGAVAITVGKGVEVPAVTGTMTDEACKLVGDRKLTCVRQAVTLERGKTRNQVFEQDPAPGTRVDQDSAVVARYWGDPRVIAVPDVTGKTPKEACDILAAAGFTCRELTGAGRPLGQVVLQSPSTGRADEGSEVAVTVATSTTMPSLVDGSSVTVCATLTKDLGLPAANCSKAAADAEENPKDTVKATTPPPGQTVTLATLVTYVRRTGLVKVPNVVGLGAAEGCNAMRAAGLGTCTQSDAAEGPPGTRGTVGSQTPLADVMVAPGKPVSVAVFSAQRVSVPAVSGDINVACGNIQAAGLTCNPVPDSSGSYRQVSGQSPGGGVQVSEGSAVTVSYEPSIRKPLMRLNRGGFNNPGTTFMLTTQYPGTYYDDLRTKYGFNEEGPICNAYADGEAVPDRTPLVDWMNTTVASGPFHTFTTGPPPPGSWDTLNNPKTAVVAKAGPVQIWSVTRGYSQFFTSSRAEADGLVAAKIFPNGPYAVFTCW